MMVMDLKFFAQEGGVEVPFPEVPVLQNSPAKGQGGLGSFNPELAYGQYWRAAMPFPWSSAWIISLAIMES